MKFRRKRNLVIASVSGQDRGKEKAKWQPQTLLILNRIKIIMEMNSFEDSPAYSRNAIG